MSEHILFLTGKLAENSLRRVLSDMQNTHQGSTHPPVFTYEVMSMGVSVAALLTPEMIGRRLKSAGQASRIMIPGLCKGDLKSLEQQYGIPVQRGPEDVKDIPHFFGQRSRLNDLSQHSVKMFAEIVDAPYLTVPEIVAKAAWFRQQGADVIDLGCIPNVPFSHLNESIQALKAEGYLVSVDSLDPHDLAQADRAGVHYLLSLSEKTIHMADSLSATPVIIPAKSGSMPSLYRAIEHMLKLGRPFLADAILDPIPFGFTQSLVRYQRLRKRYPEIQIMMGVGNLTELTDADTAGINALLFGVIAELGINAVLATAVSPHARHAVAEADVARRVMHAAQQENRLPRDYSNGLLGLHDRRPGFDSMQEVIDMAGKIKDPSFRIRISQEGMHIFNRDGLWSAQEPFALYPHLKVEDDASHAFYLGVELARAQIAWQLGKRYRQDEPLTWGVSYEPISIVSPSAHREASLREKREQKREKNKA